MAVTSARSIVNVKEKIKNFERENARITKKYTLADELPVQLSELSLRSTAKSKPSYTICKITYNDKDRMIKYLRRFFFRDEPMNLAVNLLETPDSRCLELEEYVIGSLEDGVSVAAVDEDGNYIGVLINGIIRREEADYGDKSDECSNPKFKRILRVLSYLNQQARIWDHVPQDCNTIMEVRIASTHTEWRGRGVMGALCKEAERLARDLGASVMRMDTTSAFSAAAAERLKYKKIYSIRYADMEFAPQPEYPHTEARVYIKEL